RYAALCPPCLCGIPISPHVRDLIWINGDSVTSFFFSSRRRHTRSKRDWSSDVCSSDLDDQRPVNVSLFFNIGRLGLEYDSSTPVGANLPVACGGAADCVPGYMRDTGVSVLGMRLSNSQGPNAAAQARFDGRAYVCGF